MSSEVSWQKTAGWHRLKSLWQLQTCVCNREMEHWKEIKTHAGCYSHQINVTNTMKGTFRWLEKYLLTEHNFISMSFNNSKMTGHKKSFSLPPFPSYVLWMLISVSFSDSPSLVFISGRPSNWLTCVSKGEQHHIRPEASTRKKRWLKRSEGREIHLQAVCRISPHFLYFSLSPHSHSPAHTSLSIFYQLDLQKPFSSSFLHLLWLNPL